MPFHQLFYHLVWSTKNREATLTPETEAIIFRYLRNKALTLEATVFSLNGYRDHVHLIATIPPKIAVANFIGQIKAVSSMRLNKEHPSLAPFYWQDEYAVFSFDRKRLKDHVEYVERQKEHHQFNRLIPILEHLADEKECRIAEPEALYMTAYWEDELNRLVNE